MPLEIKHQFQSAKGDGPDSSLVQPSDWNALHEATLEQGVAGNPLAGVGPLIRVPLGVGLAFKDGALVSSVSGFPIGSVIPYAGSITPSLWLLCFGQEVDRTFFAQLYAAIGITYGVGNGTSTFNVPDLRGRVGAGKDNMGGTSANRIKDTVDGKVLGNAVGAEKWTLLTDHMPGHTHTIAAVADHTHHTVNPVERASSTPDIGPGETISIANTVNLSYRLDGIVSEPTVGITSGDGGHTHTASFAGGNVPHMNMQPSIILNYIIYTGVEAPP